MRCSNCNKENAENAKFCVYCGSALGEKRNEAKIALAKSFDKRNIIFGAIILIIALGALLYWKFPVFGARPAETIKNMVAAMQKENYLDFKNCFSKRLLDYTKSSGSELGESAFKIITGSNADKSGVSGFDITKEEIKGKEAQVCYTTHYGDKTNESECLGLVKESGEWKIDAFGTKESQPSLDNSSKNSANGNSRDLKRQSDMRQLISAQEMYYGNNDGYLESAGYPDTIGNFIIPMPTDPITQKGYDAISNIGNKEKFCYYAKLEAGGYYTSSQNGVFDLKNEPESLDECAGIKKDQGVDNAQTKSSDNVVDGYAGTYADGNSPANYDELKPDGTYISKLSLNGKNYDSTGTYEIIADKIIFTTRRNEKEENQTCNLAIEGYECIYFGITHRYYKQNS